jgi:non-ribosomal peptide synthase protein (TIGR01720 family)
LRAHLSAALPDYMVPRSIVQLERLPLSANGKLDRAALPAPQPETAESFEAPRGPAEETLCRIWAEVLRVPAVGVHDDFFELGGDSIIAIQLVSRARQSGLVMTPREVFQHQTVAELAVVARPAGEGDAIEIEPEGAGIGQVPATPIMRWFERLEGPTDDYSQRMLLRVPVGLDVDALTAAYQTVLDHHDVLRLRAAHGTYEVMPKGTRTATVTRIALTDESLVEGARQARESLDPEAGIMTDLTWFDAGPESGLLLFTAHHLVVDGVSWRILLPDLVAALSGLDLQPVSTSFRRWAQRLTAEASEPRRVAELGLWSEIAATPDPLLGRRALDPARDTFGDAGHLTVTLPAEVTEPLLSTVPAAFHGRVNDVLLTGLALAVSEWRRSRGTEAGPAVLLDLEGHGREEIIPGVELSRTSGWFTSIFPVRVDAGDLDWSEVEAAGPAVGTAIKRVKEQLRDLPDNGIGYGLLRHANAATGAVLDGHPTPQLAFNYLGRMTSSEDADWSPAAEKLSAAIGGGHDAALGLPHAIEVNCHTDDTEDGSRLSATWSWAGDLFDRAEIEQLAGLWFTALTALVTHAAQDGAGGFTPSDLALVELSQDEIDEFAAELEDLL